MIMTPEHAAATTYITRKWLLSHANGAWNYGRYMADVESEYRRILSGITSDNQSRPAVARSYVKWAKRQVLEQVLVELAMGVELAEKACQLLKTLPKLQRYTPVPESIVSGSANVTSPSSEKAGSSSSNSRKRKNQDRSDPAPSPIRDAPPPPYSSARRDKVGYFNCDNGSSSRATSYLNTPPSQRVSTHDNTTCTQQSKGVTTEDNWKGTPFSRDEGALVLKSSPGSAAGHVSSAALMAHVNPMRDQSQTPTPTSRPNNSLLTAQIDLTPDPTHPRSGHDGQHQLPSKDLVPRSPSTSATRASSRSSSSSVELPPTFFMEFDAMSSQCGGCCVHGEHADCAGGGNECCAHPPTLRFSSPAPKRSPSGAGAADDIVLTVEDDEEGLVENDRTGESAEEWLEQHGEDDVDEEQEDVEEDEDEDEDEDDEDDEGDEEEEKEQEEEEEEEEEEDDDEEDNENALVLHENQPALVVQDKVQEEIHNLIPRKILACLTQQQNTINRLINQVNTLNARIHLLTKGLKRKHKSDKKASRAWKKTLETLSDSENDNENLIPPLSPLGISLTQE